MDVQLHAEPDLNSHATGEPNAVLVRVYSLARHEALMQAPAETFWQEDEAILGSDLIRRTEIMLTPGMVREMEIEVEDGVRFVAVAADFFASDGDGWHQIVPVSNRRTIRFRIGASTIEFVN